MTPSDFTADLPAPRDDEPSSLRRDIVDELADHLASAVRREELRSGGPVNAAPGDVRPHPGPLPEGEGGTRDAARAVYGRVLARFGDPRAVARKLWWDHMQERIMAQRLTALMAGTAAVACVAACLVLWQFVQDSRDSQAAALAEMREFNAKLLAGLQRPAEAPAAHSEWAKVRVKLVDAETGEPVAGAKIALGGTPLGGTDTAGSVTHKVSSPEGTAQFNPVPPGSYGIELQVLDRGYYFHEQFPIGPGFAEELVYRVPVWPLKGPDHLAIPADEVREHPLWYVLTMHVQPVTVDGHEWKRDLDDNIYLVNERGDVCYVAVRSNSGTHDGRDVCAMDVRECHELPASPAFIQYVQVVQPIESETPGDRTADSLVRIRGYDLMTYGTFGDEHAISTNDEKAGGVALPQVIWRELTSAEIRAGLKPPPPGMQIADFNVPLVDELGVRRRRFDLFLTFQSRDAREFQPNERTIRLLQRVEPTSLRPDPNSLDTGGNPTRSLFSLLVTDEQAALVELARKIPNAVFSARLSNGGVADWNSATVDSAMVDLLNQELETGDASNNTTPNG